MRKSRKSLTKVGKVYTKVGKVYTKVGKVYTKVTEISRQETRTNIYKHEKQILVLNNIIRLLFRMFLDEFQCTQEQEQAKAKKDFVSNGDDELEYNLISKVF